MVCVDVQYVMENFGKQSLLPCNTVNRPLALEGTKNGDPGIGRGWDQRKGEGGLWCRSDHNTLRGSEGSSSTWPGNEEDSLLR